MNWQALRSSFKYANPLQVMARYIYRGIKRVVDLDIFRVMYLPADSPIQAVTTNLKLEFGFAAADVVRRAAADTNSGLVMDSIEVALARQEECFGAWLSQQLISHLWLSPNGAHLCQDVYVHFDTAYAYSRWAYTRDEYRGQHLHSITKHHALNQSSQRGKLGILSVVDVGNFPSLRAAKRSGCRRVGLLLVTRIGKRRIILVSSGCRAYGLRLESAA